AVTLPSGATLAPGDNFGTLTVSNSVTLQPGSTTRIELDKDLATNDVLICTGTLNLGGTLVVARGGGPLTAGDAFTIFSAPTINGNFATINLAPLGAGLAWNTNNLAGGHISVIATVPPQFSAMNQTGDGNFHF